MIGIFTTEDTIAQVREIIDSVPRLSELVTITDILSKNPEPSGYNLIIRKKTGIKQPFDWYNVLPPFLLPDEIELTAENLLGLLFAKLGNYEKAYECLQHNKVLLNDVDIVNCLQNGIPVDFSRLTSDFDPFEEYRFCHNSAILHHYAATEATFDLEKTKYFYNEAIVSAPNGEYLAFSARQFAIFLTDLGELDLAERLLQDAIKGALSDDAEAELNAGLCGVWLKKLVVPYDLDLLEKLKETLGKVLAHYQKQGRKLEEGLLLVDAAQVANYSETFAESLGYVNRAVDILRSEEVPELLAQAQYRKGILLYTWAKKDNPQFFRPSLEAFQEALKIFSREEMPDVYADIQQYLGVIYAEIPDDVKKKSIWAGISAASFQQALAFYTKETHPYEYAMVCNNYANALSKYPEAIHTDNLEKALFYYAEALMVRTPTEWPFERAATLLNYLQTCWHLNLAENGSNQALFEEMVAKANEARHLTNDPDIIRDAELQLEKLAQLRVALEKEQVEN